MMQPIESKISKNRKFEKAPSRLVSLIFFCIGIPFMLIGLVVQWLPLTPNDVTFSMNGVVQPHTESALRTFRLIFLLSFGGIGLIFVLIALFLVGLNIRDKERIKRLKSGGNQIIGHFVGFENSHVHINNEFAFRLLADFVYNGQTYQVKSKLLINNPEPLLKNDELVIYFDPQKMKNYYIAVDESVNRTQENRVFL